MDTDILKADTGYLTFIERPSATPSRSPTELQSSPSTSTPDNASVAYLEPVSEGEDDDEMNMPAKDEDKRTGLNSDDVKEAVAFRERMLKETHEEDKRRGKTPVTDVNRGEPGQSKTPTMQGSDTSSVKVLSITPLAPSSAFDETLRTRLHDERTAKKQADDRTLNDQDEVNDLDEELPATDDRVLSRDWSAPAGKKIAIPVRIEPKVYFAAERTFLVCELFLILLNVSLTSTC